MIGRAAAANIAVMQTMPKNPETAASGKPRLS
jgi:hypothetical protein